MLFRAFAAAIVVFWVVMMGMLARVEFSSGESELLPIPVTYVWKLVFLHEQSSDFVLYHQRQRLGSFHFQPRRLPTGTDGLGGPVRLADLRGGLTLNLPGISPQSVSLRASLELDEHNDARVFGINASFHEPGQNQSTFNVVLDGHPARDDWHYQLRRGEAIQRENSGTSAVLLDALDLRAYGLDPKVIMQAAQQRATAATSMARRGVLRMNDEGIDCYIVTLTHGDSLETTIYVSQLGQILAVKTFAGYDLYDDSITP